MINDNKDNSDNAIGSLYGLKAQKEPSPGQSETSWSGTLGKMYPDGPRPAGARGNVRNVNPDETSNVPCCHFAFPFGRRRVAPLPFPSAGDLRFRAQGMWVARIPRVSLVSLALPWARFLLPRWGVRVNGVYYVRRVKSVKSDKSVFNTFPFSEIKNIGLL